MNTKFTRNSRNEVENQYDKFCINLANAILAWWESVRHETIDEHGERNQWDKEPDFVVTAKQILTALPHPKIMTSSGK